MASFTENLGLKKPDRTDRFSIEDFNGNMDIIVGGYIGTRDANAPACYSSPLRVYENKPEKNGLKGNTFPDAPGDVSAEMQGNELVQSRRSPR